MICPKCRSAVCRRSRRRGVNDHMLGLAGLRPWRCKTCDERFFAWLVPTTFIGYVHCPRCGNLDLQRISRDRVTDGWFLGLRRVLGFPAYRCEPCRMRFFSLRPYRRIIPTRVESSVSGPQNS